MLNRLKAGWQTAKRHPWMISMLFAYQMTWGFLLYQVVQHTVLPLLYRFPSEVSEAAVQVFLAEAQFLLMKTDAPVVPLALIAGIVLTRMMLTPLINAGIYYSIHRDEIKQIRPFINGVKQFGLPFAVIYVCQLSLALLPLLWIIPHFVQRIMYSIHDVFGLLSLLPYVGLYLLYLYSIHLSFMYIQFGTVSRVPLMRSQKTFWRNVRSIIWLGCMILLISGVLAVLNLTLTFAWASFISVMLHQFYYLSKAFVSIWEISAQHHLWKEATH